MLTINNTFVLPGGKGEKLLTENCHYICIIIIRTGYGGYLLFGVNTKYISSNVMKISVNSRVRSMSEISDIFNTSDKMSLVLTEKSKGLGSI